MEIAIVCAAVLSAWLIPSLWIRLRSWTLADVFLLSILMNFGAFVFVDAIASEPGKFDSAAVAWVFLSALVAALALRYAAPRVQLSEQEWASSPGLAIGVVIAAAVAFRWYTSLYFSEFDFAELAELERELPYWYTTAGMLVSTTILAGALASIAKYRATRSWLWLGMAFLSAIIVFGMGRRALLALVIVGGWMMLRSTGKWRAALLIVCMAPVLLAMSNLYQVYRAAAYRGVVLEEVEAPLVESAIETERTLSNLQDRETLWRFNHDVVRAHLEERGSLQWGGLLVADAKNYVPAALWPGKEWKDVEESLLEAMGMEMYDRPSNIFAYTYADFGLLGIIAAPAFLLGFIALVGFVLRRLRDPFLKTLLVAMAVFYALQFEAGYLTPIALARDFIIVATVYMLARGLGAAGRALVRGAIAQ